MAEPPCDTRTELPETGPCTALSLIGRPELEDVLGREARERLPVRDGIFHVFAGVEGVAARHFPARRQPAGYFRLEALAAHLPAGLVAAVADFRIVGVALRAVADGDAEQRERGVQAPVQPIALDPHFRLARVLRVQVVGVAARIRRDADRNGRARASTPPPPAG
ncbi:hypothetical protein G6F46_014042 [Rhizopus delemar]|nr:hypothetical protein G6F46_014042 [Rhizopus delemar]